MWLGGRLKDTRLERGHGPTSRACTAGPVASETRLRLAVSLQSLQAPLRVVSPLLPQGLFLLSLCSSCKVSEFSSRNLLK